MNTVEKIEKLMFDREDLQRQLEQVNTDIEHKYKDLEEYEQAITLAVEVARKIQDKIKVSLTSVVNYALQKIFESSYEFSLEFDNKYGKSVVHPVLFDGESELSPTNAVGGGVLDLVAISLRISLWALQKKVRNIMIFDEPFKFLSVSKQRKIGLFIGKIAEKLNLQFIIVTHSTLVAEQADKIFNIVKIKGVSKIKED